MVVHWSKYPGVCNGIIATGKSPGPPRRRIGQFPDVASEQHCTTVLHSNAAGLSVLKAMLQLDDYYTLHQEKAPCHRDISCVMGSITLPGTP